MKTETLSVITTTKTTTSIWLHVSNEHLMVNSIMKFLGIPWITFARKYHQNIYNSFHSEWDILLRLHGQKTCLHLFLSKEKKTKRLIYSIICDFSHNTIIIVYFPIVLRTFAHSYKNHTEHFTKQAITISLFPFLLSIHISELQWITFNLPIIIILKSINDSVFIRRSLHKITEWIFN